jgi:hypothetical protein
MANKHRKVWKVVSRKPLFRQTNAPLEEKHQPHFLFSTVRVEEQHICTVNTLFFSKQLQYSLRDEDFDYNHEMKDMEDSSAREESTHGDVFED